MNNLIYYPSFEIQDENWLKLALLYFDNIHLIIPHSGDRLLSPQFKSLDSLIYNPFKIIRPESMNVDYASRDATDSISNILRYPERYANDFNLSGSETIIDKWKNKDSQQFEIFNEKYTWFLEKFFLEHDLAHKSDYGIKIAKELADIFMALLAKSFGDQRNLSPITDTPKIDFISNKTCQSNDNTDMVELGFNVINIYLPENINRIPLNNIIEYRNSPDFIENLQGFHNAINDIYQAIGNKKSKEESIPLKQRFEDALQIRNKDLLRLGGDLIGFGIGCWIAFSTPITLPIGIGLAVDTGFAIDGTMQIKKQWKYSKQKINSKRFVTGIRNLTTK